MLEIITLTLFVSGIALIIAAIIGVPLGAMLALRAMPLKKIIGLIIYTGMGLPPVVVGLAVYIFLSREGALGWLGWLFTPSAMITAQVIIALPIVIGLTTSAVENVNPELRLQIRSLGATPNQVMWTILSEARSGVVAAIVAAFGGIISEVGAVMLVGGNIEGSTRVLTTAIVLETRKGDFALALALGGVLLTLTLITNFFLLRLNKR
ncbi:MAG: ABC transporter permease [Chloroflexi bacterium]|nr:ABC transporter permease [Chloroflexota bacterium]MBI5712899.1 ABC transporter permease [Chloroflexota bacterium]